MRRHPGDGDPGRQAAEVHDAAQAGAPVTLTWDNGKGLTFQREVSVDEDYMFTVTDKVQNTTAAPVSLQPYGIIARHGLPKLQKIFVVHEGAIQRVDGKLTETDYGDFAKFEVDANEGQQAVVSQGTVDGWPSRSVPTSSKTVRCASKGCLTHCWPAMN